MTVLAALVLSLAAVGVGAATAAEAQPRNPCAQFLLTERCAPYLGGVYRRALAADGIHRPAISNRVLGQIAGDICRVNNVRDSLEWVLVTPDFRISQFYITAHKVC